MNEVVQVTETNAQGNIARTLWQNFFQRQRDRNQRNEETINKSLTINMTTSNQRGNNHWGDESTEKTEGTLRVYSTNVNGISLDRRGGKFNDICSLVKEIQCDIFCGQEYNMGTNQSSVRTVLYDTAKQHWDRIRLKLDTAPIEFKTKYKPGGTLILTTGNTTGRTAKQEQDKW